MNRPGGSVRAGIQGIRHGRPHVALERLGRPAEPHKDVPPAHVRVCVFRLDLDGPVVLGERICPAPGLRQYAPHGRMRVCVAGIGRNGHLVPADRLAAVSRPLCRLAGDHVACRRVGIRRIGLFDRPAVERLGRLPVAAHRRPDPADERKHGREGRHLRQALFDVPAQDPQEQAHVVPPVAHSMRIVVAHAVHAVRRIEQLGVVLEHARHAELGLDRLYVADALDPPVVPEQVGMAEEVQDAPELVNLGQRDAHVDGGVHAGAGVEPALAHLSVEQLYARRDGDRDVPQDQGVQAVGALFQVEAHVDHEGQPVAEHPRRDAVEPPPSASQRAGPLIYPI